MGEPTDKPDPTGAAAAEAAMPAPLLHVAPAPHVFDADLTTRRMMIDVLIALTPVVLVSLYVFRLYAAKHIALCGASCLAAELVFTKMRRRRMTLKDGSAAVTGLILALSLPGAAPWYVSVIGSFVAIGIGKVLFGGLGQNIFNPAMVGRAFVMLAFSVQMGAGGYKAPVEEARAYGNAQAVTRATPMTVAKKVARGEELDADEPKPELKSLFLGNTNGSLGETSALACLIGGLYLLLRRTASWQVPAGVLGAVLVIGGLMRLAGSFEPTAAHLALLAAMVVGTVALTGALGSDRVPPAVRLRYGVGVSVAGAAAAGTVLWLARPWETGLHYAVFGLLLLAMVGFGGLAALSVLGAGAIPRRLRLLFAAGVVLALFAIAGLTQWTEPMAFGVLHHLLGGALLFGALFIATDLVTSPLTPKGKLIFGAGVGAMVMLIRTLSNYPEGVMFAVLLMNALVPLINRWTVPVPVGGPVPERQK